MAKAKKKSAKEASNLFHNIMKASVSDNKTFVHKIDSEKLYINGKDFLIEVEQDGHKIQVRIYELPNTTGTIYKKDFKSSDQPAELLTIAKQWITGHVTIKKFTPPDTTNTQTAKKKAK